MDPQTDQTIASPSRFFPTTGFSHGYCLGYGPDQTPFSFGSDRLAPHKAPNPNPDRAIAKGRQSRRTPPKLGFKTEPKPRLELTPCRQAKMESQDLPPQLPESRGRQNPRISLLSCAATWPQMGGGPWSCSSKMNRQLALAPPRSPGMGKFHAAT